MPSKLYYELCEQGRIYHTNRKVSRGVDVKKYLRQIKILVDHFGAKTMLDYGCGKGEQYSVPRHWRLHETEPKTLDQYLNLDSFYAFDPWVVGLDQLPSVDLEFDCIICTQVLGNLPEEDFPWLLDTWSKWAKKFIFIGELSPSLEPNRHDRLITRSVRTIPWYLDQFENWQGCPIFWYWKGEEHTSQNAWYDQGLLLPSDSSDVME